MTMVFW